MTSSGHVSFFMTKKFEYMWNVFVKYTDNSPEFQKMLLSNTNKDGRPSKVYKKGKDSARIRFAIKICVSYLVSEQNKHLTKEQPD